MKICKRWPGCRHRQCKMLGNWIMYTHEQNLRQIEV